MEQLLTDSWVGEKVGKCKVGRSSEESGRGFFFLFFGSVGVRREAEIGQFALSGPHANVQSFVSQKRHFNGGLSPVVSVVVVAGAAGSDLVFVHAVQDSVNNGALCIQLDAHQTGRDGIGNIFEMHGL